MIKTARRTLMAALGFRTEIFSHSRKKIATLDDFNGLKMRTAGGWPAN